MLKEVYFILNLIGNIIRYSEWPFKTLRGLKRIKNETF